MSVIPALQKSPLVDVAEPNFVMTISVEPNDPYFKGTSPATYPYQWGLKNTGQSPPSGTTDADIDAPEAWDLTTGSSNVIIAILDSGIPMSSGSLSHPDLDDVNKIIIGRDFIEDVPNDTTVRDQFGHGTHVAGIAAAESNNSTGVAGVAWNCKLMIIQVFDANGVGTSQAFYDGVKYAVDYYRNNPNTRIVINYSGGGSASQHLLDGVAYANTYGVTVIAAAGNNYGGSVLYPAAYSTSYSNILAVSSTDHTDTFSSFSNQGPQVNISAPGGYGGYLDGGTFRYNGSQNLGRNIFSTTPNYAFRMQSYPTNTDISQDYGYVAGTSMAAPHVSGTVALILSLDSSLTPPQIRDILQQTADKVSGMGGQNFTNQYGYGRLNVYRAVLQPYLFNLASQNKSINQTATANNNGRRLVKDYSNAYHLVYASGGEIFYRKSENGSSWLAPIRVSKGNGSNDFPCLTQHNNGALYAVWQRKTGTSSYEIWFAMSLDNGDSWADGDKYVLATASLSSDPLPVIQADVDALRKVVVFRNSQGLTSYTTTWQYPYQLNWTQKSLSGTSSSDFWPSLTDDGISQTGLAYAKTTGKIYYRYFPDYNGNWSSATNLSDIVPGSNLTHKEPSLSALPTGPSLHIAWHRVEGSGSSPYDHEIVYRKATNYNTWPNEYTLIYYESQQLPSITALASNKIDILFQLTSQAQIYKQRYNGSYWSAPTYVGSGRYPSVSTDRTTAKYVWTSGSSSPYTVQLSTEVLSKESPDGLPYYSRSIAWLDSSGAYLEMQVHQIGVKMKDSTEQNLEFVHASLDSFELRPTNSWDLLTSAPVLLPVDAESLIVDYTVVAKKVENVAVSTGEDRFVTVVLSTFDDQILTSITGPRLTSSGDFPRTTHRLSAALGTVYESKSSKVNVRIDGLTPKPAIFASLGHIYDFTKARSQDGARPTIASNAFTPRSAALFDNYPNPFNPTTAIKYELPSQAHVTLSVYNMLGQEIRTLVDKIQEAGSFAVSWDGKDQIGNAMGSGIYFCRIIARSTEVGGEVFETVKKMTLLR